MKIGFITMHRVMNHGSILQAYALQRKLNNMAVDNEIIDFVYPPKCKKTLFQFLRSIIQSLIDLLFGFPLRRKTRRFKRFYKGNLAVTSDVYDKVSISKNPPLYDAYLSGSDQVWNPKFIKGDTSFLLSFVSEDKPRAAYASSFAINEIPENYRDIYARELNKFQRISVREESGISIVKSLTGKDANLVCDPTLLLDQEEWGEIAKKSALKMGEKYILVYVLSYMYNPYPQIYNIVEQVQKEFGDMKVVYLIGKKDDFFRHNSRLIKDAGPNEFVYLFQNAEFVITTSFHGTAFSAIFGKPLYAVVKSLNSLDGRMPTLLKRIGGERSLINFDEKKILKREELLKLKCKAEHLNTFREESVKELEDILQSIGIR